MPVNRVVTRIVSRNDIAANWLKINPILLKGELGIEIDTNKMKIGDGVTKWSALDYANSSFAPANGALLETITEEKITKWDNAQPNTIESIFVNGSKVSIIDKRVDISVPTKAEDIGAATEDHNHDGVYVKLEDLKSYVDEVIEYDNFESLPIPGVSGKIYVTIDNNKTYRWSGTQYTPIGNDLALGETASTAFRGDLGKIAYDHALVDHAPATAQENVIESLMLGNNLLPVEDKCVSIPVADSQNLGVVKSSNGANKVNVSNDGSMKVSKVGTQSLVNIIGSELILDGGSSDMNFYYASTIDNVGYRSLGEAVSAADKDDVVTLQDNVDLGYSDDSHLEINSEAVTLNLNNKELVGNGSNGVIKVNSGITTLEGEGTIYGSLGSDNYSMAVWATGGKVIINGGTYRNTTDGSVRGTDLIYASGNGQIEINGGIFEAATPEWTLNCKDDDYNNGKANIIVKGGSFKNFDPSNCKVEGENTNFVAEGYTVVQEGEYYIVNPVTV